MKCIKLIETSGDINYLIDFTLLKVNDSTKKLTINISDNSPDIEITYTKNETWNALKNLIENACMNECSVTVYGDETAFEDLLTEIKNSQRQPGQP